jgi:hypothetical protein
MTDALLRGCASRWSWAAVPAVAGPGAADQAATDHSGADQRQPEVDDQPSPLGAPAQLAVLVAQAWVRSITQRRPTWIGAGTARVAIWPTIPRSARTSGQGVQS